MNTAELLLTTTSYLPPSTITCRPVAIPRREYPYLVALKHLSHRRFTITIQALMDHVAEVFPNWERQATGEHEYPTKLV